MISEHRSSTPEANASGVFLCRCGAEDKPPEIAGNLYAHSPVAHFLDPFHPFRYNALRIPLPLLRWLFLGALVHTRGL